MNDAQHIELLDLITDKSFCGKVLLSTYPNDLYAKALYNWKFLAFEKANAMSHESSKSKKVELVYFNYEHESKRNVS
jgi:hypothetical protein